MKRARHTIPARTILPALMLTVLLAGLAAPAAAEERVGQLRAVHYETQRVRIDNRTYRLAKDLSPRYAGTDRLADLRSVRSGMPVEYEFKSGTGSEPVITRLILLADE